jgi:hypothetical protein
MRRPIDFGPRPDPPRAILAPRLSRRAGWIMLVLAAYLLGQSLQGGDWASQYLLLGVLLAADGLLLFFNAKLGFYLSLLALGGFLVHESFREWKLGVPLISLLLFVRLVLVAGILLLAWGGARPRESPPVPTKYL